MHAPFRLNFLLTLLGIITDDQKLRESFEFDTHRLSNLISVYLPQFYVQ